MLPKLARLASKSESEQKAAERLRQPREKRLAIDYFRDMQTGKRIVANDQQIRAFELTYLRDSVTGAAIYTPIIFYGGRGGGKTGTALQIMKEDIFNYPGNRGLFVMRRKTAFIELMHDFRMVYRDLIRSKHIFYKEYKENNSVSHFEIGIVGKEPTLIYNIPMDHDEKLNELKNIKLGFALVDQLEIVPYHTMDNIIAAVRLPNTLRRVFATANPQETYSLDIKQRYKDHPKALIIEMQAKDNPGLSGDYHENLDLLDPAVRRWARDGKAGGMSEYCLDNLTVYENQVLVEESPIKGPFDKYILLDCAGAGGTSWALEAHVERIQTNVIRIHIEDELPMPELPPAEVAQKMLVKWPYINDEEECILLCDPTALHTYNDVQIYTELQASGLVELKPWDYGTHTKGRAVQLWNGSKPYEVDGLIPNNLFTINKNKCHQLFTKLLNVKWTDVELFRALGKSPTRVRKKDDHAFDCGQGLIRTIHPLIVGYDYKARYEPKPKKTPLEQMKESLLHQGESKHKNSAMSYLIGA